jgi:hypothetical protein
VIKGTLYVVFATVHKEELPVQDEHVIYNKLSQRAAKKLPLQTFTVLNLVLRTCL